MGTPLIAALAHQALVQALTQVGTVALAVSPIIALEMIAPRYAVSVVSRLRAAAIWIVYSVITGLLFVLADLAVGASGLRPFMPAIPVGGWLGVLLTALASFVLTDFLIYWCHRAQHRLLWRSHAVHHSISEMSAANFYVHWTEHLFRIPLVTIPVALLSPSGDSLAIASALVVAQNAYAHSAAKFDLGPLRWLIVGNRWHRIHHSLEPTHFDRNFGNALIVWDVLFGTASFPKAEEWPAVGLDDQAEPDGIVDYLTRPFRPSARPQTAEH